MVEDPQKGHSPGVPSLTFFPRLPPGLTHTQKNVRGGHPRATAIRYGSSGSEGGRRRTSSVVSDFPATDYVTTLLVRRWDACGVSRGVPEGRG
jgi:hypothetical protein